MYAIGSVGMPIDSTKYTLVPNHIVNEVNKDLIRYDRCLEENKKLKDNNTILSSFYKVHLEKLKNDSIRIEQLEFRIKDKDFLLDKSIEEAKLIQKNYNKTLAEQRKKSNFTAAKVGAGAIVLGIVFGLLIN